MDNYFNKRIHQDSWTYLTYFKTVEPQFDSCGINHKYKKLEIERKLDGQHSTLLYFVKILQKKKYFSSKPKKKKFGTY